MRTFDTIYTDHQIDDLVTGHLEAMEAFIQQFPMSGHNVYADGKIIMYKIRHPRNSDAWLRTARLIIQQMSLPLQANKEEWSRGGEIFEVNLCIEYKS